MAQAVEEEVKEEKTEFDVKLTKFGEGTKIKVIKEVRNVLPDLKLAEVRLLDGWVDDGNSWCLGNRPRSWWKEHQLC